MEFLAALAPIALILVACVGLHFFMMRGMHGGHGAATDHAGHAGLGDTTDTDRVAQLESQVARLQREIETSQADRPGAHNGHLAEPAGASHHHGTAAGGDPERGYN